ncbi:50S ribosomal protein L11 methyltransferase [Clostridium sp. 'White wine YQ']|uniref:50S ribosomal protein L11 methyltransferase n=1 Tax=Clostridium sp. 'White wine YQ' TaxID=3027474 RepID=UPI0023663413|nr:50S ribosomal protein L11 methyltransferase [Clostridium sp. 'White wine YQ']MDD7794807.1 50S ribosomal protein L11 methyltransferase [Clostridium sp. 'White wine YQ']
MFEISFIINHSNIEDVLERLEEIGLSSTYYETPFQVTIDNNGYGYYEKEDEDILLKVYPDCESEDECLKVIDRIKNTLKLDEDINLSEINEGNWQEPFEPVDLKNGWVIGEPSLILENYKKINFEPQGSFGTGLHETTQDMLRYILDLDFSDKKVLDLGAGSGILGIGAALKNASKVVALDIRDVTMEVMHNAALNNLSNVEVLIKDVTKEKLEVKEKYDFVFINIGGEETLASMELINSVIESNGILLVSGLVEWSYEEVFKQIEVKGYSLVKKTKSNEWVTLFLQKSI